MKYVARKLKVGELFVINIGEWNNIQDLQEKHIRNPIKKEGYSGK